MTNSEFNQSHASASFSVKGDGDHNMNELVKKVKFVTTGPYKCEPVDKGTAIRGFKKPVPGKKREPVEMTLKSKIISPSYLEYFLNYS